MARIRITAGKVSLEAELNTSTTAKRLLAALPIEGRGNRWGDEIYFSIPVSANEESGARADMAVGEIAYWPPGSAFCIFWGPTPASDGDEPRAASPVNPLGKLVGDATLFGDVPGGTKVRIEAV
ncbi:MAG: hypothetical protein GXY74_15025 [Phycisphaerae bacterium]|nr:hypothetical protein [Phycisphaerae bacterium]